MSSLLKWTESTIEKFDTIASKAFNLPTDSPAPQPEPDLIPLQEEIKLIKSITNSQLKDLQEKYALSQTTQNSEITSLKSHLKSLTEENNILKEHLRNSDSKLSRLQRVNEELSSKLDLETQETEEVNSEVSEYQINLLTEKIKRLSGLLKAEKLKTVDALQEKSQIGQIIQSQKELSEERILKLKNELSECQDQANMLKSQLDSRPKAGQGLETCSLNTLSEMLQAKQRKIESLLSEKSALVLQLENEKNEKFSIMESRLKNRVTRQPLTQLGFLNGKRHLRRIFEWLDDGVREFTDLLEEVALARLAVTVYLISVHSFLFYWIIINKHADVQTNS